MTLTQAQKNLPSMRKFANMHGQLKDKDHQRAGQRFVNMFVKHDDETTKKMFYESDERVAFELIFNWLCANQHIVELPLPVPRPS